jgi:hypothetical protein
MSQTALDKIKAIEEEAQKKIAALKQEAVTELVKKIAEAKSVLSALEEEYSSLTGKTLKGDKVPGTRRRLSPEEKAALAERVKEVVASHKDGVKLGKVVEELGESPNAVREAIKSLGKTVTTTGNKASTLYFAK